jgi:hypothetical protein
MEANNKGIKLILPKTLWIASENKIEKPSSFTQSTQTSYTDDTGSIRKMSAGFINSLPKQGSHKASIVLLDMDGSPVVGPNLGLKRSQSNDNEMTNPNPINLPKKSKITLCDPIEQTHSKTPEPYSQVPNGNVKSIIFTSGMTNSMLSDALLPVKNTIVSTQPLSGHQRFVNQFKTTNKKIYVTYNCMICFCDIIEEEIYANHVCSHTFHFACITQYMIDNK